VITQHSSNRPIWHTQFQPLPGSEPLSGSHAYAETSTFIERISV
jgi:hypothetical protein